MKKFLSMMAIVAMALCAVSCGDDEPTPVDTFKTGFKNLTTKTSAGGRLMCDDDCVAIIEIDYAKREVDIEMQNIKFVSAMPDITFEMEDLRATINDPNHISFSGTNIVPMEGYTINDLTGSFDFENGLCYIRYTVVSSRGSFDVVTYVNTKNYTSLSDGRTDFTTTSERFYRFIGGANTTEFSIYIHNIKFVDAMPLQKQLRIPVAFDKGTSTATGYTYQATGIVPYFLNGSTEVQMPERQVDNLILNVDVMNKRYQIEFDCFNLHFTDSGSLYM